MLEPLCESPVYLLLENVEKKTIIIVKMLKKL